MWSSNENYGTNCDNVDMLIKEISEIAEDVGLDNIESVSITEVLESHSIPLPNEELYYLAQQLTVQHKEDDDDRGTKVMQMKGLTGILSARDMAAEKLCDIDPEWEAALL